MKRIIIDKVVVTAAGAAQMPRAALKAATAEAVARVLRGQSAGRGLTGDIARGVAGAVKKGGTHV